MSEDSNVIVVKGKGKWKSKFVCTECKSTKWKTVKKGADYKCRGCGSNTSMLFVWDGDKKGLVMWVPPQKPATADGVEPTDGVEPLVPVEASVPGAEVSEPVSLIAPTAEVSK